MAHRPHKPHNFRALSKPKNINQNEHRHYWPYIPLILLVVGTFLTGLAQPLRKHGVLAYATDVSASGLLQATNTQRSKQGNSDLQLNDTLSAAAQAKANDMIARNYWSHNTPEGQAPWVFIDNAGYKYLKAGENLAYGFVSSDATVTGWMNSPSHRANLLDNSYSEVGFGFANGPDYNKSGEETVVVAMYGRPHTLGAVAQTQNLPETKPPLTLNTDVAVGTELPSKQVARIQAITKESTPWALFGIGVFTGLAVMLLLVKHTVGLRHLLRDSERFVLHHPMLDTVLVSLVLLGSFLSQTTGFIR